MESADEQWRRTALEARTQNAELVTALLEIRWRLQDEVDAWRRVLARIDAILAKAKP